MRFSLAIVICFLTHVTWAQTKVVSALPEAYEYDLSKILKKGQKRQEKDKDKQKAMKEAKKALKEELKQRARLYDLKLDSLEAVNKILKDSSYRKKLLAEQKQRLLREENLHRIIKDPELLQKIQEAKAQATGYLSEIKEFKLDSGEIKKKALQKGKEKVMKSEIIPGEWMGYASYLEGLDSIRGINFDSMLYRDPPPILHEMLAEEFKALEELKTLENQLLARPSQLEEMKKKQIPLLKGQDYLKTLQNLELDPEVAKTYFDHFEQHQDKLEQAQKTVALVKKKPTLGKILEELIDQKQEEVKEQTLRERFFITGMVQINNTKPFVIDANPGIGYNITGRISAGVGGKYRFILDDKDEAIQYDHRIYGFNGFLEYQLLFSMFLHGEYQQLSVDHEGDSTPSGAFLLGLGRDLNYKNRFIGRIMVLYNFNKNAFEPFSNQFSARFGFKF